MATEQRAEQPAGSLTIEYGDALALMRRRGKRCTLLAVAVTLITLVYFLFVSRQAYQATVSVSMQSPSIGGGIQSIIGLSSGPPQYVGAIRSMKLAAQVEDAIGLSKRLGVSRGVAIDTLMNSTHSDEGPGDGLVYIKVSLLGPPRLSPQTSSRKTILAAAASDAANAYVDALASYFDTTDNSRDASLRRGLVELEETARAEYATAFEQLRKFIAKSKSSGLGVSPPEGGGGVISATQLQIVESEAAKLAAEIARVRESMRSLTGARKDLLKSSSRLLNDPLLVRELDTVKAAKAELKNLKIQFADTHPEVLAAEQRLRIAQEAYNAQLETVKKGTTTEELEATSNLQGLIAQAETLRGILSQAHVNLQANRNETIEYVNLKSKLELIFEAWKTTAQQAATVRATTSASHNRVVVVDPATPSPSGSPNLSRIMLLSVLAGIGTSLVVFGIEYILVSQSKQVAEMP